MISRVFIERPRLAGVVSIVLMLAGILSIRALPVAQYPQVAPPQVTVVAAYPGAGAEVLAATVAGPIEDAVNGVDDMIYMSSTSDSSGTYMLSVSFKVGTDPDMAQVKVQNRVSQALPLLPVEVVQQGVQVQARSTDMLGFVTIRSPGGTHDELFLSDYTYKVIKPALERIPGVSEAQVFGPKYSMRVWMDADRMAALGLSASEVMGAIRSQNIQASLGAVGAAPGDGTAQMVYTLKAEGRLNDPDDFGKIIVRTAPETAAVVYLRDVARVEKGAENYLYRARYNGDPVVAMGVSRATGSNALEAMDALRAELEALSGQFPADMEYVLPYDATDFVRVSIREIISTLLLTGFLVILVCYLFLQDWRATLIPALTIPVSLCATFAVLMAFGYTINTLTLFGLVLAIGLVVDDAIVVVERVLHLMESEGLDHKAATIKAMEQVTGAVIATTLVLLAIFVPIGFAGGITGEIYKQFAVSISAAVTFSTVNALTLSPALCATVLQVIQPKRHGPLRWFNTGLGQLRGRYVSLASGLARRLVLTTLILFGVFGGAGLLSLFQRTSFLPEEDQGVIFGLVQLPEGAARSRTEALLRDVITPIKDEPGVAFVVDVTGFSMIGGSGENMAFFIAGLDNWQERRSPELQIQAIQARLQARMAMVPEARINLFVPPAIMGLGVSGGLDIRLQAIENPDPQQLNAVLNGFLMKLNTTPGIMFAFSGYAADTPHLHLEIDRVRAALMQVEASEIFAALQSHFGSRYISDVNFEGQVNRVILQAGSEFRDRADEVLRLHVKSRTGAMVPLGSLASVQPALAPRAVDRYNKFTSAGITAMALPFLSSGDAMRRVEEAARESLPEGYTFAWSGLSYQEATAAGGSAILLVMALLFGYLFLVAQYESWIIPMPVMVSTSVAAVGALGGLLLLGMELSIYAQLGLILLVGLSGKNAILIVEFSRTRRDEGMSIVDAAADAAGQRFRAVLMTACTFILGIFPMVIAVGAGSAARRSIGTVVFCGMLAATVFGMVLVPGLYALFQTLREKGHALRTGAGRAALLFALLFLVAGCMKPGKDYLRPEWPDTGLPQSALNEGALEQWWMLLDDSELPSLIGEALEKNHSLHAASAAVRSARAQLGMARAALGPRFDFSGSVGRVKQGDELSPAGAHELYRGGFDAAWEIDLFGGTRRAVEAAEAAWQAGRAGLAEAQVSLAAETAQSYILLRTAQQRLLNARAALDSQQQTFDLVESRFQAGLGDELALALARSQLETVRATVPPLETAVERSLNALAVLTGQMPGSLHESLGPPNEIPALPTETMIGIPADLLRRRPDVRRAERELAAQTARIGAAKGDLYPKFTLLGSIGLESLSASSLFNSGSNFYNIGPGVRWPIFHWGSIRSNIRVQEAAQEQALARYEQTVLMAVQETRDALAAFDAEQQRGAALEAGVAAARHAAALALDRYESGLIDFQGVLDAQQARLALEDGLLQSRGNNVLTLVRLYKALGGGWTPME